MIVNFALLLGMALITKDDKVGTGTLELFHSLPRIHYDRLGTIAANRPG